MEFKSISPILWSDHYFFVWARKRLNSRTAKMLEYCCKVQSKVLNIYSRYDLMPRLATIERSKCFFKKMFQNEAEPNFMQLRDHIEFCSHRFHWFLLAFTRFVPFFFLSLSFINIPAPSNSEFPISSYHI